MLSVVVCHTKETSREAVGNWSIKMEIPEVDRIDQLTPAELHEIQELVRLHGLEGVRVYHSGRVIWPPAAGEPYIGL